jgi:hypothetical protein
MLCCTAPWCVPHTNTHTIGGRAISGTAELARQGSLQVLSYTTGRRLPSIGRGFGFRKRGAGYAGRTPTNCEPVPDKTRAFDCPKTFHYMHLVRC